MYSLSDCNITFYICGWYWCECSVFVYILWEFIVLGWICCCRFYRDEVCSPWWYVSFPLMGATGWCILWCDVYWSVVVGTYLGPGGNIPRWRLSNSSLLVKRRILCYSDMYANIIITLWICVVSSCSEINWGNALYENANYANWLHIPPVIGGIFFYLCPPNKWKKKRAAPNIFILSYFFYGNLLYICLCIKRKYKRKRKRGRKIKYCRTSKTYYSEG